VKVFASIPKEERALYWRNYSNRTGTPEFIAEKDFWVCGCSAASSLRPNSARGMRL